VDRAQDARRTWVDEGPEMVEPNDQGHRVRRWRPAEAMEESTPG
jgi:hypothetical protein